MKKLQDTKLKPFEFEGEINGEDHAWRSDGTWRIKRGIEHPLDLFLLPPDEIVVEVVDKEGVKDIHGNIQSAPPGKYRLVKFD